jgi:DNA mismatch endonuclease (patch repair protein)
MAAKPKRPNQARVVSSDTPVSPERSAQMALVKARDTKPEIRVRKAAHAMGLRYRLNVRKLPGSPDLVFPSRKVVLFVHGCFWHRHKRCKATRTPKSRIAFWEQKFAENMARDQRAYQALRNAGWKIFIVWECETSQIDKVTAVLQQILSEGMKSANPK